MKTLKKITLSIMMSLLLTISAVEIVPELTMPISVEAATKVKLNKTKATLIKGQTLNLKVLKTKDKITWSSSKPNIATVNSKGKVTAKRKGNTIISAKIGVQRYTCKITVQTPTISKKTMTLTEGQKATLKIKGTTQKIKWRSSNSAIASVNTKGSVTAKKAGTAIIKATVLGKTYKCKITVKAPDTDPGNTNTPSTPTENNDTNNSNPEPPSIPANPISSHVYISPTGSKYHSISNCGRMNPSKATRMTEQEAINQGYSKCSKCF